MNRRQFLQTSAAPLAASLACGDRERPPNVVVCLTDQFRSFEAGCYGNPVIQTPHIDRLAGDGVRFDAGVTNSPVCTPARANLMSGQYARTSAGSFRNVGGMEDSRTRFPDPTLTETLKDAGYQTAHIGKWHLHVDPFLLGFDYAYYPVEIPHNYYGRAMREAVRSGDKLTTDVGEESTIDGFMPGNVSDKMREYVRGHRDEPFFLNYSVSLPHMPIGRGNMPDKYVGMYNRNDVLLRDNVWKDGKLSRDEWWFKVYLHWDYFWRTRTGGPDSPGDKLPDGFDLRDLTAYYYGAVTCTDDLVGELMDALEENGLADNTIVVLSSDHGEMLGSHNFYNKDRLYEEAIRVPMIYRHPNGWGQGVSTSQVASNIDIMPTVLDACGVGVPGHVQGQSLLPVIKGEREALDQDYCVVEAAGYQGIWYAMPYARMGIRTPTHMYGIELEADDRAIRDDRAVFYDLREDPYELNNLAGGNEQAKLAEQLRAAAVEWHQSTPWFEVKDDLPHL